MTFRTLLQRGLFLSIIVLLLLSFVGLHCLSSHNLRDENEYHCFHIFLLFINHIFIAKYSHRRPLPVSLKPSIHNTCHHNNNNHHNNNQYPSYSIRSLPESTMSGSPRPPPSASAPQSRPRPSTSIKQPHPYRPVQLTDIIHKLSATMSTRSSSPISHTHTHSHRRTLSSSHHPPSSSPPTPHPHPNHPPRTITPAEASLAASTSLERSDNHRAMIHQKKSQKTKGSGSLSLRTRYAQQEDGRSCQPSALQRRRPSPTTGGSEFLILWDAWDNLKRVIVKALQRRRARKSAEARRSSRNPALTTKTPTSTSSRNQTQSKPLPPKPLPPYPTPIYDAHRKHRSGPAPKEFYLAWAAVKEQQQEEGRAPSPPLLPTITRKPLPPSATTTAAPAPQQPKVVIPAAITPLPSCSPGPPRVSRRSSQKITPSSKVGERQQRRTRFSDFLPPRPNRAQSNILTGSGKQIRLCDVCGCSCCAARGTKFGAGGVWLCGGCFEGEGEGLPLRKREGETVSGKGNGNGKGKMDILMPMGKDVVWNCEHCFASFASERPSEGEVCVCPVCGGEIGGGSRCASRLSRKGKGKGKESGHFSEVTEASEKVIADGNDDDNIARPSIYRPSLYEDDPIISTHDSPVSPVGQGRFDNFDRTAVHPALRPLPPTLGLPPTPPSEKRPDTAWRNSIRTRIPGIDTAQSYHTGPVIHVAYEYPSNSSTASAVMPQAPVPTPTITCFKSKTDERKKEAQYERKSRGIKHIASSIYPEDQRERVYTDDKPLPEMPKYDRKRDSFYPKDS